MPKFYGQNKKRINPRYFLNETSELGPPDAGVGNLTIADVEEALPHVSSGVQADVWERYKHLNNKEELLAALERARRGPGPRPRPGVGGPEKASAAGPDSSVVWPPRPAK